MFGDGIGILARRVGHDHPVARGGVQIDGIEAHPRSGDVLQVHSRRQGALVVGVVARKSDDHAGKGGDEFFLRPVHAVRFDSDFQARFGFEPLEVAHRVFESA